MAEKMKFDISWGSLWKILFFVGLAAAMWITKEILIGLFLALVISSGLENVVTFLERRGLPRTLGVIIVFLIGILTLISILYAIVPFVIVDVNSFLSSLKKSGDPLGLSTFINLKAVKSIDELVRRISSALLSGGSSPLDAVSQFLGGAGLVVAVFVSSFYLSLTKDGVERFIRAVLPSDLEESALKIYERSRRKIGFWFRTQILLSVVMGVLVWAALSILGVKHAFLLGFLAGILEIVPFVGPIVAGAAATLAALVTSVPLAISTLVVFVGIHQLESHVMVPLLMRRSVGLHPVIVIVALLVGIELEGVLGALVAIPAAAVLQEIVEDWSSKKKPRTARA